MTTVEIQQLADTLSRTIWREEWPYFVTVLFLVVLSQGFLIVRDYFGARAKNAATKADIAEITRRIESVRHEYVTQIETIKGRYQLRFASQEKILATHQIAFSMWRKMLLAASSEEIVEIAPECENWWTNNCVYLSAEARDAFLAAVHAAHIHRTLRGLNPRQVHDNWEIIVRAGDQIMKGAELPALPPDSLSALDVPKQKEEC